MTAPDPIVTPALLLDLDVLAANIARMGEIVAASGRRYRPHVKSHKCVEIARMQMAAGACGVCCANVREAEAMVEGGIGDVLLTSPLGDAAKAHRMALLARRANVALVADNAAQVALLARAAEAQDVTLDCFVEVDVGQGRCGVRPGGEAADLAAAIDAAGRLRFAGLQGYNGAIQMHPSYKERAALVGQSLQRLLDTRDAVEAAGHRVACLTGGGTGTLETDIALGGLDELQPGSYVAMDSNYRAIQDARGGHPPFAQAIMVLARVISRPDDGRAIVDVGWKSISSDGGVPQPVREGLNFAFAGDEHGVLHSPGAALPQIGEAVALVPTHCDTTVNLYDAFVGVRGGRAERMLAIQARGGG